MFKNRNRTLLFLCLLLIGTCSYVFAIDFSQALGQAKSSSFSLSSLFQGKSQVTNLYQKALKLAKDREVVATTTSLDQLTSYYSDCALTTSDFINVLYNSNSSFALTFGQILPASTKAPSNKDINKSYAKFFACKKISVPATSEQITALNNEINAVYYDGYANTYSLSTLNQDNFGSDLFWNGTLDDSDFDLLYDINQVGKVLFEAFQDSPEVLFYRLPEIASPSAQNGGALSSITDQSSYQVGNGGSSFSPTAGASTSSTVASSNGGSSSSSVETSDASLLDTIVRDDPEIQTFLTTTNTASSSAPTSSSLVFGNQCLSGTSAASVVEEQSVFEDPAEYISGIVDFITAPNITTIVNENLLDNFITTLPTTISATGIANAYAEQAFGEAVPGSCAYSCRNLPLDKQALCELDCSKACIQTCSDTAKTTQASCSLAYDNQKIQCNLLSGVKKTACLAKALTKKVACVKQTVTDQALCISNCTCFLISGPHGPGWEKIEDMYRIKFCKVPVQSKVLSPGKTVFSIQAIFQEIADVLEGLRDSGQMVKFSQTKEFLDGTIKIKFPDNFAFKLQVGFKPVFPQKSTTTKLKEQQQEMRDFSLGVVNMNIGSPEADDYNKYIVISDPVTNDATMEQATSLEDIQANIAAFTDAATRARTTAISGAILTDIAKTYANKNSIALVQNMVSFLQDNQTFWNNLSDALLDMNKMSVELKAKIENSK